MVRVTWSQIRKNWLGDKFVDIEVGETSEMGVGGCLLIIFALIAFVVFANLLFPYILQNMDIAQEGTGTAKTPGTSRPDNDGTAHDRAAGALPSSPIYDAPTPRAPSAKPPAFRIRRINGVAYSYSKKAWAVDSLGSGYPNVRLAFSSGLVIAATMSWEGMHSINNKKLYLECRRINLPRLIPVLKDHYKEIGVGYYVELDDAVFADYTAARTIIVYETFSGDNPPEVIGKTFDIIPVTEFETDQATNLQGEWEKTFEVEQDGGESSVRSIFSVEQNGKRLSGTGLDYVMQEDGEETNHRWELKGWVLGDKITFVKWYEREGVGVAYLGNLPIRQKTISGTWYSGLAQGKFEMKWTGELTGSPVGQRDLESTNPPERRQ